MLSNIQAMILVGWRLCKLYDSGKLTHGHASLGKVSPFLLQILQVVTLHACFFGLISNKLFVVQSWITLRARETVALGRELLGGNGILADFQVAKVC